MKHLYSFLIQLLYILLIVIYFNANAQSNDPCSGVTAIAPLLSGSVVDGGFCNTVNLPETLTGTSSAFAPIPDDAFCGVAVGWLPSSDPDGCNDGWFRYVVPASGVFNLNITNSSYWINFALYSGTCAALPLTPDICLYDGPEGNHDLYTYDIYGYTPGETIFIRAWDYNCNDLRSGVQLCITEYVLLNDPCGDPAPALTANVVSNGNTTGTTTSLTDYPEPACGNYIFNCEDTWFQFTAPSDGDVTFDITRTGGGATGTSLAYEVYQDACPTLTPLACDNFHDAGTPAELNFVVDAGQNYFIRVWDYDCNGDVQFTINPVFNPLIIETPCEVAPLITIGTTAGQGTNGSVSAVAAPTCGGFTDPIDCEDAWFKYVVPAGGGSVDIDFTNVGGTSSGTSLASAIYYQTGGSIEGTCDDLTLLACDGDHLSADDGVSASNLQGGTVLYIRVWDLNCNLGTKTFDIILNFIAAGAGNQTIAMNGVTDGSTVVVNCGSTITITDSNSNDCSGTHPTGQSNCYSNNEDYTLTLVPSTPGQQLMLIETGPDGSLGGIAILQPGENSVNETVLSGNDYLYMHDGTSTAANISTVITGEGGSAPKIGTYVTSNGGLTLHFISSETGVATGFIFEVTCTAAPTVNAAITVDTTQTLTFADPGGCAGNYGNNQTVVQTYCPDAAAFAAGEVIYVDMGMMDLTPERRDLLYVFDGPDINSPLIGKYGGESNPLGILRASPDSPTGCLTFLFVSDASVVDIGWCASVYTAPPILPNGADDCADALDISSPGTYQSNSFLATGDPFGTDPALEIGETPGPYCDPTDANGSRITQLESSLWYKFTVPPIVCGSEPIMGVQIDNVSSIYINSDGSTGAQFVLYETDGCLGTNDWDANRVYCADKLENGDTIATPPLSPGEVYYIMVDAFGGRQTNFDLKVSVAPLITDLYDGSSEDTIHICTNNNTPSTASNLFDLIATSNTEVEFIALEAPATLADGTSVYNAVAGSGGVISLGTAPVPIIPDGAYVGLAPLNDATLPPNNTCQVKTYNIYVRSTVLPGSADCRPYETMQVKVYPYVPTIAPTACNIMATANCAVTADNANVVIEYSADGNAPWVTDPYAIHALPLTNGEQIFHRAYLQGTPTSLIDAGCLRSRQDTVTNCVNVGDLAFIDLDNDGLYEPANGELPLAGVTVELYDATADTAIAQYSGANAQTTDTSGNYLFTGVPAGTYYVVFTTPSGYQVSGAAPEGDNANNITGTNGVGSTDDFVLDGSVNNLSIDAGFTGTGSIGDYVWEDTNGDGIQDESGTGIDGVDVALTWYGPDGVLGGGDDVLYPTTTTSGGGNYIFDNLPPGVYVVDVVGGQPSGSSLTTGNDPTAPITLIGGQDYVDADFGYQPATASIGDYVFIDINNDGVYNGSDQPLSGVTATLYDATTNMATSYTDVTDASGNYLFTGVPSGNYYVVFTAPSGYQVSGAAPEGDNANNITGLNGAGSTDSFTFDGVTNNLSIDAGFTGTGSIGDYVWEDTNGDGIQDESGTGIDGVDVALTWYGPDGVLGGGDDVLYPTTTTIGGGELHI
ncbi:MAG: hypothetical protein IPL35_08885 [Sphingobacteriales bacterium]|nr:hypothetical protein [Sphingobacteriales bacterium]